MDGGPTPAGRSFGSARHPVAALEDDVAVAYAEAGTYSIGVSFFSTNGVRGPAQFAISDPSADAQDPDPVVAVVGAGVAIVGWTDTGADGDERGVALRRVDKNSGVLSAVVHANQVALGTQSEVDVLWTGKELVAAWSDFSDLTTGPDVKVRRFTADLAPLGDEVLVASSAATENAPALSVTSKGWAVTWRSADDQGETAVVAADGATWSVGPFPAANAENRNALVELDDAHLMLFYAEGGLGDGGPGVDRLRVAILDKAKTGAASAIDLPLVSPSTSAGALLGTKHPSAVRVGGRIYVSFVTASEPGSVDGEQLWLKELSWTSATGVLDASAMELPLVSASSASGDQRHPSLASNNLAPQGAIAAAWEDAAANLPGAGGTDVVFAVLPTPVLLLPSVGGGG